MRKSSIIRGIKAREILDSRGNPTLEVGVKTECGFFTASVPSGASTGKYEAYELRDGGKRYGGKGVRKAVDNVNGKIGPKIAGKDAFNQKEIDELMAALDGSKNKSRLGGNAICGVSLAVCRAAAAGQEVPLWKYVNKIANEQFSVFNLQLPRPGFNVINGGSHAGNDLDFQEFMIMPQQNSFAENLRAGAETYHQLKKDIAKKYGKGAVNLGDEGGFAPPLGSPVQALDLIWAASKKIKYANQIILDAAASQFYDGNKYKTEMGNFGKDELAGYYLKLINKYPILGLEDPFAEDDWKGWEILKSKIKNQKSKLWIIGDDLLVTNPERIKKAREKEACNAMILKINQIGTVSEALQSAGLAKKYGWKIMVSHRSGETNDDFISDFSVGIGADFIKSGAPSRGERLAKYNRLMKIESEMKKNK